MATATDDRPKRSSYYRSACLRCGLPIEKGEMMEKAVVDGYNVSVHVGCKRKAAGAAQLNINELVEELLPKLAERMPSPSLTTLDTAAVAANVRKLLAEELSAKLASILEKSLERASEVVSKAADAQLQASRDTIMQHVADEIQAARLPHAIDIHNVDTGEKRRLPDGLRHAAFERVYRLARMRRNIFLPGPAGCGKTFLAKQVADELGLRFGVVSLSGGISESKLVGRVTPNLHTGEEVYHPAPFVEIYEGGGVFLADEMDAADPNVLLAINSALANGYLAIDRPGNPIANRHPDFVMIAAANTFGNGADRQYVGRTELDKATLDRFRIGVCPMDYDPNVEAALCPNEALRELMNGWRQKIKDNRIEDFVSTRFMADAYLMVSQGGFGFIDVAASFFAGWPADQVRKVRG